MPPVIDRSAAKARLIARYTDESAPIPGHVAMRCSEHDAFVMWVNPPTPNAFINCPATCDA